MALCIFLSNIESICIVFKTKTMYIYETVKNSKINATYFQSKKHSDIEIKETKIKDKNIIR